MKKLFSFFAALLFAGSMMATDVYSIDFKKGQGEWTIDNVTLPSDLTYVWQQNASYGMKASAYNKKAYEAVSWLVSPKIDLSGKKSALLTFSHAVNKGAPTNLEVRISCEGQGTEKLDISAWPAGTDWDFVEATADLSKFVGKKEVVISFVYTSTTEVCPTWEIANVAVSAEEDVKLDGYYVCGSMTSWGPQAAYKLAADGELYKGEFSFAVDDEFKVIQWDGVAAEYTWFPTGMGNNFKITEAGDYMITFNPAGGVEGWYEGYFNVVKKEAPIVVENTCADVYKMAKDDNVDLNPVTVTYVNGANVYVKDETGSLLIYLQKNTASWVAGDVLTGLEATLDIYNGLYELKPTAEQIAAVSVSAGEAPAPEELLAVPAAADVNKYVIIKGVSVEAGEFTTDKASNLNAYLGEGTFVLRNNFRIAQKFEEGKTYDIVGAVAIYTDKSGKTTVQLYFISAKEIVDPTGYFIVGNFSDWKIDADYKLAKNPAVEGEYMAQMFLSPEYAIKIVYTEDGENIKTWYPEGTGNAYGENGEITASAGYTIYFRPAGGVEGWFHGFFYVEQVEEVDVTISNGLIYNDAVASEGWWDIYGENDKFAIELSNLSTTEAPGYYDMVNDLDPDYCWIVDLTNPNDTIGFVSGGVTLAISAEGVVTVIGQLAGNDGKIYNINLTYTDPKPEKTVVVNITNGAIDEEYASYGLYLFYGEDPADIYVQLEIWPDEFPGNFTTADLTSYIAGSLVEDNGNLLSIFSVEGSVVAGATEGVYTLTADILCYNNTLYKVTMKIGEDPQGINNVDAAAKAVKALRNGILVIEKNGVRYNVNGAVIR